MFSRLSNLHPIVCGVLAGALALGAYLSYYQVSFGVNQPPGASGDEPEYDSLAWEMAHGRGFRVDYSSTAFRRPYEQAAEESELYRLTTAERIGTIASRPPLFPFVMSLTDRLLGRQFWAIRIVGAACMAAICGMLVTLVCRDTGPRVAIVSAFLFVAVDTRTRLYGRAILTEAMATLEVAVLCWLLFRLARRPTPGLAAAIGGVLALAILTRTQFVLWLPGLMLVVFWLSVRPREAPSKETEEVHRPVARDRMRRAIGGTAAMLLAVVVLTLPWMVRNCLVLGEFMPLGTQGWSQLSAAFGDAAWEHRGLWTNLASEGFFDSVLTPEMTPIESELAMAYYSRQQALEWIAAHPGKALALAPLKILQEFRPRTIPEGIILALSILGAVLAWREERTRILLAVVLCCCVGIAAMWSVEGRFLVPLLFAQHGLIGLGLVRLMKRDQT